MTNQEYSITVGVPNRTQNNRIGIISYEGLTDEARALESLSNKAVAGVLFGFGLTKSFKVVGALLKRDNRIAD